MDNKEMIKLHCNNILDLHIEDIRERINRVVNSGCIDVDNWNDNINPMLLPKAILSAIYSDYAESISGKGTCFEKSQKKEINNIKLFL